MTSDSLKSIALSHARFFAFIAPFAVAAWPATALAQPYSFWGESYQPSVMSAEPPRVRRLPPVLPKGAEKAEKIAAEGNKPQGPLVIAISIQNQHMKVYDSRGLFAESPISSGMAGHSTPMGVFSVIQKRKIHRSNIYSGAPMPYMQRITWSGVAMHAGVLPGYPASHGCIRMPMSFAMKMWSWTKMGARVVVTPDEVSPAEFSHPLLASLAPPQPVAAAPVDFARMKTADASGRTSSVSGQLVMVDVATNGIAAVPTVSADATLIASGATATAAVDDTGGVVEPETTGAENMPPLPAPALVDFSDVATDVPATAMEDKAEARVDAEGVGSAAIVMPPQVDVAAQPEAAPVVTPRIKRNSPVAMFVSRKDRRLYVRQNFTPVFEAPIDIAAGSNALGTHVFTAGAGLDGEKALRWSVVSLPAVARQASARPEAGGNQRRRTAAVEVAAAATDTAEEALARISLPPDLMSQLGDALPPGSSLVVSDQGIAQGETGEGTDFIVRLR